MNEHPMEQTPDTAGSTVAATEKWAFFPSRRMDLGYPWQVWIVGWLAIFKGLIWLSTTPNVPDNLLSIFAFKYLIFMIPFIVLGIAVWNLKKWGAYGIMALCIADLAFFIFVPQATGYIAGKHHWIISACLLLCNGPVGNVVILVLSPFMVKHLEKPAVLKES